MPPITLSLLDKPSIGNPASKSQAPAIDIPNSDSPAGISQTSYISPLKGTKTLYGAVLSDEHLHSIGADYNLKPDRQELVAKIKELTVIAKQSTSNEVVLFVNGDFLDYLESYIWEYQSIPSHTKPDHSGRPAELTNKILSSSNEVIEALEEFLEASERTRIVFSIGNHDRRLQYDNSLPVLLQKALLPQATQTERDERIKFTSLRFICNELGLYGEHGDRIDSYDSTNGLDDPSQPTWGDNLSYITINILRKQIEALDELRERGKLSLQESTSIIKEILEAESIREIPLFEPYLESVCDKYVSRFEKENRLETAKKVKEAFNSSVSEFANRLKETPFLRSYAVPVLGNRVGNFLAGYLHHLGRLKLGRNLFCREAYRIYADETHDNKHQVNAMNEILELFPRTNLITMGHTHKPIRVQREDGSIFVNSGAWIPEMKGEKLGSWYRPTYKFQKSHPSPGLLLWRDLGKYDNKVHGKTFHDGKEFSYLVKA